MHMKTNTLWAITAAAVLYLGFSFLSSLQLSGVQVDMTEEKLYTLTDGTKEVLQEVKEPVQLTFYYSEMLGDASPAFKQYAGRIKNLLERYVELSSGQVELEIRNPEPYSVVEDEAMASGLEGVPINNAGDLGYFGLVGTNQIDAREAIPFLSLDRERFLEYDLTKMIYSLSHYQKTVIGILNPLKNQSNRMAPPASWTLFEQLGQLFEVHELEANLLKIPEDISTLVVVKPSLLPEESLQIIEQYALAGKRLMLLVDPISEQGAQQPEPSKQLLTQMLAAWGVGYDPDRVLADYDSALQVQISDNGRMAVEKYIVWLGLDQRHFDSGSVVMSNLEKIQVATAGFFTSDHNATDMTFSPLITLDGESSSVEAAQLRFRPDVAGLIENYQPDAKSKTLALQVSGLVKAALADENNASQVMESKQPINVLLVADSDFIKDSLWMQKTSFLGQELVVPTADNGNFFINALDHLQGDASLIALRGRGQTQRPFALLDSLKADAERRYKATERQLIEKLKTLEEEIRIQGREGESQEMAILTQAENGRVERAKTELLAVRKELRDVRLALRQEIEQVESVARFINIFLIPGVLIVAAIGIGWYRRSRQNRLKRGGAVA